MRQFDSAHFAEISQSLPTGEECTRVSFIDGRLPGEHGLCPRFLRSNQAFATELSRSSRKDFHEPRHLHVVPLEPNPCEPPRSSRSPANPGMLVSARLVVELKLFGEWRSSDEVCEIWRCEPLNVSNAKIPKNVVNRRHRFLTNDVAKASFKSVLECQPRKCG